MRSGQALPREAACQLVRCPDEELPSFCAAAVEVGQRFKPDVITYSRKVFIPLTNLCRDYCGYCTFRRDPGQPGAHTMTPEEVLEVAQAGEKLGCTEALFSLGDKPELVFPEMRETLRRLGYNSTLQYLEAMCELVLRRNHSAAASQSRIVERGMDRAPGRGLTQHGADAGNHQHFAFWRPGRHMTTRPTKFPRKRLRTIEEAGKQNVPFTTGLLIGIGETLEDRVDTLLAIRELHRRYGHIQEVIVQNFRAKPDDPHAGLARTHARMKCCAPLRWRAC